MSTSSKMYSGYTGLYRQPYANQMTYGDTIYVIMDELQQEANVLMLTPGAYKDAYRLLSMPSIQFVNIFVPSMDVLWISDIFRLVVDLIKIKREVKFYYPEKISVGLVNALFNISCKTLNTFRSKRVPNLLIKYEVSSGSRDDHRFYNIIVSDDSGYHLFTLYMDAAYLATLIDKKNTTIHMPYNTLFYGGLTAPECYNLNPNLMQHVVVNNFACREEFVQAMSSQCYAVPRRLVL